VKAALKNTGRTLRRGTEIYKDYNRAAANRNQQEKMHTETGSVL